MLLGARREGGYFRLAPTPGRQTFHGSTAMKRLTVLVAGITCLLLLPLLVLYAAFPAVVAWLASHQAENLGLSALSVTVERPGIDEVRILQFSARSEAFELRGEGAKLTYSPGGLWQQRGKTLEIESVSLRLNPAVEAPMGAAGGADSAPLVPDVLFGLVPLDRIRIVALSVEVPALDFSARGDLTLADGRLATSLEALTPERARDLQLSAVLLHSGEVVIELSQAETEDEPFLRIRSGLPTDELVMDAEIRLSDFVLELISTIAGLPPGGGTVQGLLRFRHPWSSVPEFDWGALQGTAEITVDWRSTDERLTLRGLEIAGVVHNGILNSELEGTIGLDAGALQASFQPHHLEVGLPTLATQFDTDLKAGTGGVQLDGRLRLDLPPGVQRTGLTGSATFQGVLEAADQRFPVQIAAEGGVRDAVFEAQSTLAIGTFQGIPARLRYEFDDRAFALEVRHRLSINKPLFASLWTGWARGFDVESGALLVDLALRGSDGRLDGLMNLGLEDVGASLADAALRGLNGTLNVGITDGLPVLAGSELSAGLVDFGVPIRQVATTLSGTLDRLDFGVTTGRLLGGSAWLQPFSFAVDTGQADLDVRLEDLDLAAILALEGGHITGSGRLDGSVPVRIRSNLVRVESGRLVARPPGGTIRLSSGLADSMRQPGLDLAIGALTNFNYGLLEATVSYSESGDLALGVRLEGQNPEVEKGRPIHYNLQVSENIPILLESLRMQDAFIQRIEKKVTR